MIEEEGKWIIKKDEKVQINLFRGDDPYALGHIVIQPVSNADDISSLRKNAWEAVSEWVPKVSVAMRKVLREITGKEVVKIYLCSFNESPDYPVHFHLIPRYECETLKGPDLMFYRSKARNIIAPLEKQEIVRRMKNELRIEKKE